jgi:hypothetical protein
MFSRARIFGRNTPSDEVHRADERVGGIRLDADADFLAGFDPRHLPLEDLALGIDFRQVHDFQQVLVRLDGVAEDNVPVHHDACHWRDQLDARRRVAELAAFDFHQDLPLRDLFIRGRFHVRHATRNPAGQRGDAVGDRLDPADDHEGLFEPAQLCLLHDEREVPLRLGRDGDWPGGRRFASLPGCLVVALVGIRSERERQGQGQGRDGFPMVVIHGFVSGDFCDAGERRAAVAVSHSVRTRASCTTASNEAWRSSVNCCCA